jgi:hypothetical protein
VSSRKAGVLTDDEMLSIMEQFENMGFLYDTGKRRKGKVVFVGAFARTDGRTVPLYAMRAAAYKFLGALAYGSGMNPGEIRATISRLKKLSAT